MRKFRFCLLHIFDGLPKFGKDFVIRADFLFVILYISIRRKIPVFLLNVVDADDLRKIFDIRVIVIELEYFIDISGFEHILSSSRGKDFGGINHQNPCGFLCRFKFSENQEAW